MSSFFTAHEAIMQESLQVVPLSGPTRDDWERHRPLIKRLYVDESRKLEEVVAIMKQYGHIATPKMYKDRIKKWRLDKKNKERDMVAILRKKTERDAVGKKSAFRVRGQPVTMEDVLHYVKRKKETQEMEISAAATPSDVSCWTPSPSPSRIHTPQPIDKGIQVLPDSSWAYRHTFPRFTSANNDTYTDVSDGGHTITPPFVVDKHITRSAPNVIYNSLSRRATIPRSPSPLPTLLIPELLLVKIKTYFEGSFESGTWITDERGYCRNITSAATALTVELDNFVTYINITPKLKQMGSLVEFRRVLSKAFNSVQGLLRGEDPLTLSFFLYVIVYLLQEGCYAIVSSLRNYIKEMATNTIARENPWGDICRLIGMLDGESLEQAIIQCWKCTHDTFKNVLGPFHISTVNILLLLNTRTLNGLEEEKIVRELLAQSEQASTMPSSSLFLIMYNLGLNLERQRKYLEGEYVGWQILSRAEDIGWQDGKLFQKICALQHIAWMQYFQKKNIQAEKIMRDLIEMVTEHWGVTHPWVIGYIIELEKWLRIWGREEEAYNLKVYRESLIEKDESDEQSIVEQSPGVQALRAG